MRNVLLLIQRYRTLITFLFLQVVALWFFFSYNRFHRVKFLGFANEVTGRVNTQYNKVEDYFHLSEENKRLHALNDSLLNINRSNFLIRDTTDKLVRDSVPYDTLGNYRRYRFRPATVVYNTVNAQKNYIQINRGSAQGIRDNMAVISADGNLIGLVVNTSTNFAQVMSLLHVQNTVSASLKKSGDLGTVEWDGINPQFLTLTRIPKVAEVDKGDSVLTSPVSFNYPPGYLIGTVVDKQLDTRTGMLVIKLKAAANFYNLQHVHVIENVERDEQVSLFKETQQKLDQTKKPK